ncbi:uncharacterized protein tamo [Planococcus citri]|uniref:uncharacterized protein tamo n=1 Tax=Planococcus citri TaxID=170843 RepID=UPI0031F9806C
MANNYILQSRIKELHLSIFKSHDAYLHERKSPNKIKLRESLENDIKEFISLVPHQDKFSHPKFIEILKRSIQQTEDFNATDAASAWLAISTYASNLCTEPWRTEYREIRLYSGFYKHHIEKHLYGAEALLELMGYELVDGCKMILREPPNADNLTKTSLNALVAMCECQVLFSIFSEVSKYLPRYTYYDILTFREMYVCSVESAIRCILSSQCTPMNYCTECVYPYPVYASNCCRKCYNPTCMPTNGYRNYYSSNVPYRSSEQLPYTNGDCNYVPTDKLIDLDDPSDTCSYKSNHWNSDNTHKYGDRYLSTDSNLSYGDDTLKRLDKVSEDRTQYRKSMEYLIKPENDRSRKLSKSNNVEDSFSTLNLNTPTEPGIPYDEVDSTYVSDRKKINGDPSRPRSRSKKSSSKVSSKKYSRNSDMFPWSCSSCTFSNTKLLDICEMCGKSKNFTNDTPLISGGKECQRCTLVNDKNVKKCAACEQDLSGCCHYV